MITKVRRLIAGLLIASISNLAIPLPAQAAMMATDAATTPSSGDRAKIASMLDRADVRAQLEANGVNPAEVKARVAALTDDEAAELAARMEQLPAGGIIGAIVFIFLVLLITDILGLTKVFPFTRSVR
jgi:hypothetical protein